MEAEVFLDELTGNMFVKHKGAVWSVNAVIVPGAAQWMKRYGPNSRWGHCRIFGGEVIDWRWRVVLEYPVNPGETRAAHYFGLAADNV
jgi:hypothetical protein